MGVRLVDRPSQVQDYGTKQANRLLTLWISRPHRLLRTQQLLEQKRRAREEPARTITPRGHGEPRHILEPRVNILHKVGDVLRDVLDQYRAVLPQTIIIAEATQQMVNKFLFIGPTSVRLL